MAQISHMALARWPSVVSPGHPALAKQWHGERNGVIRPYEFATDDATPVWWKNADGEEWRASIMDRVQNENRAP